MVDLAAGNALRQAQEILCDALSAAELIAYVYLEDRNRFFRIPTDYWKNDPWRMARFDDRVVTAVDLDQRVPSLFVDKPIVFLDRDFALWMKAALSSGQRKPRKTKYDWASFEEEAARLLDHEGDFNEGWRLADLEKQMSLWCQNQARWAPIPVESEVRKHIKRARETFLRKRAEI